MKGKIEKRKIKTCFLARNNKSMYVCHVLELTVCVLISSQYPPTVTQGARCYPWSQIPYQDSELSLPSCPRSQSLGVIEPWLESFHTRICLVFYSSPMQGGKKKVSLLGQIPWPFGWCFVLETWRIRGIIFLSASCVLVSVNIGGADRKHREQAVILLRNKGKSCFFESHFIMQGFKHKNSREWYSQLLYS